MKKKILFVTMALWIGGIETALVNLLNHLDYGKYDVTLLVLRGELDMLERVNPHCRVRIADRERTYSFPKPYPYCRLVHLTEEAAQPSPVHKRLMWAVPALKWAENRLYIRYIREQMRNEHFDTAVIYSDAAAEIGIRAIKADRYLMFYHHGAMRHVYHDQIGYRRCEKIIAVSESQAKALKAFAPGSAIIAIPNLTDVDRIRQMGALPLKEPFDKTKFHIVSVGRVSQEKGMDLAVRVCAKLVEDGFFQVCWWIVGSGPAMGEVRDTVAELHMEDHIVMAGMCSNPYPYIRQANLYVQPSLFEGYPMTILEALVLGQPVISTDNSGAKEILREGVTGLLRPADADKLAQAVESLMGNPGKLEEMRRNVWEMDFERQNQECMRRLEGLL